MGNRPGWPVRALGLGALAACLLPASAVAAQHPTSFGVDGVHVFEAGAPAHGFALGSAPGDATQETTIVDRAHHRTLSVIAVPFGTRPATEDGVPVAQRGGARAYRSALHDYRVREGEYATDAPSVALFGAEVPGEVSQHSEHIPGLFGRDVDREVFTAEWVTEAGPRLWIVRATEAVPENHPLGAIADFEGTVTNVSIWSDATLRVPDSAPGDGEVSGSPAAQATDGSERASAHKPPAYSDGCDSANYDAATAKAWRHFLGASYRDVPACGPRPARGGAPVQTAMYLGAPFAVTQFDSSELSLRWMYLQFGTPPFAGNGDELYENYDPIPGGQPLYRYPNLGGSAYAPRAGDVLSYETGGSGGHSAVVTATHIDTAGNGWVAVMEQDGAFSGFSRVPVVGGLVVSNLGGPILGWLSPRTPS